MVCASAAKVDLYTCDVALAVFSLKPACSVTTARKRMSLHGLRSGSEGGLKRLRRRLPHYFLQPARSQRMRTILFGQ